MLAQQPSPLLQHIRGKQFSAPATLRYLMGQVEDEALWFWQEHYRSKPEGSKKQKKGRQPMRLGVESHTISAEEMQDIWEYMSQDRTHFHPIKEGRARRQEGSKKVWKRHLKNEIKKRLKKGFVQSVSPKQLSTIVENLVRYVENQEEGEERCVIEEYIEREKLAEAVETVRKGDEAYLAREALKRESLRRAEISGVPGWCTDDAEKHRVLLTLSFSFEKENRLAYTVLTLNGFPMGPVIFAPMAQPDPESEEEEKSNPGGQQGSKRKKKFNRGGQQGSEEKKKFNRGRQQGSQGKKKFNRGGRQGSERKKKFNRGRRQESQGRQPVLTSEVIEPADALLQVAFLNSLPRTEATMVTKSSPYPPVLREETSLRTPAKDMGGSDDEKTLESAFSRLAISE